MRSRGTNSPASSSCGRMNAGMNWTAWNSLPAKALRSSPSATPRTALAIASATTAQTGPSVSSPRSPNATAAVMLACTAATTAKARA